MLSQLQNKQYLRVVFIWVFLLLVFYSILRNRRVDMEHEAQYQLSFTPTGIDAVVYIAMGSMASGSMVDYSALSLRRLGKYNGPIYVITDSPTCFAIGGSRNLNLNIITVSSVKSIIDIKVLKTRLLSLLPDNVRACLYIDADILVTRSLESFLRDLNMKRNKVMHKYSQSLVHHLPQSSKNPHNSSSSPPSTSSVQQFGFGAFLDAGGHYMGFCSGCEKWHTGVLWLKRGDKATDACLKAWGGVLESGKYDTDQQSLDDVEAHGKCNGMFNFNPRHLLFAKDYIGWCMTAGATFVHLTSAARLDSQDYFYRSFVVPYMRRSLHLGRPENFDKKKQCGPSTS